MLRRPANITMGTLQTVPNTPASNRHAPASASGQQSSAGANISGTPTPGSKRGLPVSLPPLSPTMNILLRIHYCASASSQVSSYLSSHLHLLSPVLSHPPTSSYPRVAVNSPPPVKRTMIATDPMLDMIMVTELEKLG